MAPSPGVEDSLDSAARAARDERTARRHRRRKALVPYLYIAPALTMFGLFALAPFLHAVWLSFFHWDGITVGTWAGFDNYRTVFTDDLIRKSFLHAGVLVLFFSTIPVAIGMIIASVFTAIPVRGAAFFRVAIFLPQVVSSVVVGVIWNWVYATDGPLNAFLDDVGLGGAARPWLGDFVWALPAIAMIGVWTLIGLCMVLFVAGVQQIPSSLYDAVKIDGAGRFWEFVTVTWPGLRFELGVVLTLTVVGALRTFDLVFVLTRGGPGNSTIVPGMLLYNRAFVDGRVGEACAIAVVLATLVFAVTICIDRLVSRGRS